MATQEASALPTESQSNPTTPKGDNRQQMVIPGAPVAYSNESSTGDIDFVFEEETNSTRERKVSGSSNEEQAKVAYSAFTENDNFSQADSETPCLQAAFDTVIQPYVSTLPPQISQHSVFILPKPAFSSHKRSIESVGSSVSQSSSFQQPVFRESLQDDQDDPDYDFMQAQLSPDIHKRKIRKGSGSSQSADSVTQEDIESQEFINNVTNSIAQANSTLAEIQDVSCQLKVVDSEDELKGLCSTIISSNDSIVLVQNYEHVLRSYRPFQCWLLLTVIKSQSKSAQGYLIDAIRFRDSIRATVGDICRAESILKVVEDSAILSKLQTEFGCQTLNVLLAQKPLEGTNCYSTVLIEQDYRIRPVNKSQIQVFAQAQKELLVRILNLFEIHQDRQIDGKSSCIQRLVDQSQGLSRLSLSATPSAEPSFAKKQTLRGQLQRWRDKLGQTYDEGVQFILEDNLLNHLLVTSENVVSVNSLWIMQTCHSFYERALNAPYMPLYLQFAINKLTQLFQRMHVPSAAVVARSMKTACQSFVPNQQQSNRRMAVQEMSPERVPLNSHMMQKSFSHASPAQNNMMQFRDALSSSHQSSAHSSTTSMFSPHDNSNYSASQFESPALAKEQLDSALNSNPLMKQFSNGQAAKAIQNFTPKVNAFDVQYAQDHANNNDTLYERILMNKDLDLDFFGESSTEEDDEPKLADDDGEDSGPEEVGKAFKFNQDHCLHVFNTLKYGGAGNQFEMQQRAGGNYNNNIAYVNLNGQSRAEYLRHLELIDLQLDFFSKKPAFKKREHSKSTSQEDSSSSDQAVLVPPQNLRQIFQISNKNRKLNKQRKKSKLESYQSSTGHTSTWEQQEAQYGAAPPPTNVHQIIQFQYKQDCQLLANGQMQDVCMSPVKGQTVKSALQYNSQLRNMSDSQFMKHLGWLDTGSEPNFSNNRKPAERQNVNSYAPNSNARYYGQSQPQYAVRSKPQTGEIPANSSSNHYGRVNRRL